MSTGLKLLVDKIVLRFCSKGRVIDGVWIGSAKNDDPKRAREAAESAFALIKLRDPVQYQRICRHLKRIWVTIIPTQFAWYSARLDACVLDERFVLAVDTPIERIASTIVHEATHARLEHLGVRYEEKRRPLIERICIGREVAFLKRLPNCEELVSHAEKRRKYFSSNPDFFSETQFKQRHLDGSVKALRDLGTPPWVINVVIASYRIMGKIPRDYQPG
jgi:hypothetical protein